MPRGSVTRRPRSSRRKPRTPPAQSLTETLLLSLAGGIVGCALAEALLRVFISIAPAGMPFLQKATLDLRILLAAFALSLISASSAHPACIAAPARSCTHGTHSGTGAQAALRRVLVVAQIACIILLLSGAALMLHSFRNVEEQSLGMQIGGVLTANISLSPQRYSSAQKQMNFFTQAAASLHRLPGVSAVAVVDSLPLTERGRHWYSNMAIAGKPPIPAGGDIVFTRSVTTDYFHALDIPILRGRVHSPKPTRMQRITSILSSQLAARMFPNEDPIGQRIRPDQDGPYYLVIGIAANVRNGSLTGPNLARVLPSPPQ